MVKQAGLTVEVVSGIFQLQIDHHDADKAGIANEKNRGVEKLYGRGEHPRAHPDADGLPALWGDLILFRAHTHSEDQDRQQGAGVGCVRAGTIAVKHRTACVIVIPDWEQIDQNEAGEGKQPVRAGGLLVIMFLFVNVRTDIEQRKIGDTDQCDEIGFANKPYKKIRECRVIDNGDAGSDIKADTCD